MHRVIYMELCKTMQSRFEGRICKKNVLLSYGTDNTAQQKSDY